MHINRGGIWRVSGTGRYYSCSITLNGVQYIPQMDVLLFHLWSILIWKAFSNICAAISNYKYDIYLNVSFNLHFVRQIETLYSRHTRKSKLKVRLLYLSYQSGVYTPEFEMVLLICTVIFCNALFLNGGSSNEGKY